MDPETPTPRYSPALNLAAAAFFLLWAAVGWAGYLGNAPLRASLFRGPDPGPALLPLLTLWLLTAGGTIILLRAVLGWLRPRPWTEGLPDPRRHIRPMLFLASLILAVALMPVLGFAAIGFGVAAIWLFVLGSERVSLLRRIAVAAGLGAVITFGIRYGFVEVLRISLPR